MKNKIKSIPWLPYLAIEFLEDILSPAMSVFEWGSGGSTLYFHTRVAEVVSTEHDAEWFSKIPFHLCVELIEPEIGLLGDNRADPAHYLSSSIGDKNFKAYASVIDKYDDFDLVLVDGRARPSCLAHAYQKIKPGGWLILDNTERDYYLEQTGHYFDGWESIRFFGHGPYILWPWSTTFWRKPAQ